MRSFLSGALALSLSIVIPLSGIEGTWVLVSLWAVVLVCSLYFFIAWPPVRKRLASGTAWIAQLLAGQPPGSRVETDGTTQSDSVSASHADVMLARVLTERGDIPAAELHLRRAVEAGRPEAEVLLGLLLRDRGDLAAAERYLRKAADHGQSTALVPLGMVLHERGNLAEAELVLRQAAHAA